MNLRLLMKLKNYSEIKDEMKKLFAEECEKIKTETNKKMKELKSTSVILQKHVKNLKRSNEELQKKCKEHEQYGRRVWLRTKGSTKKTKEDGNDVLNQVRDLFKEAEVEILDAILDRAHRIIKKTMMSSFVLLLLGIEHCSIVTVKN